ncbi:MAG TPA: inositol monophosphatase family protein [Acidimicrobiales bacterium]
MSNDPLPALTGEGRDPSELLDLAVALAAQAADLLVDGLQRARTTVDTKTTGTDMVTEMDRASERLLVDGILAVRPDDGVLGEEGTDHAGTSGVRWVLDPLDGTTNYLYGHAGFAVSIGVQVEGRSVAGVVHDPLHGDVFTATLGGGAHRNGRLIGVSEEDELGRALVATGFSYVPSRRRRQAAVLERVIPHVRDIRRMGAAAVDLCSVACGRVDAYYERGLHPWDHAAGALVAREAGALVGHLDGSEETEDFILCAPPALWQPLQDLLAEVGAADPWADDPT